MHRAAGVVASGCDSEAVDSFTTAPDRRPTPRWSQAEHRGVRLVASVPLPEAGRVDPDMIRVGSVVIRVDDLERQAEFWQQALAYERRVDDSDDFVLLFPRDGRGPNVSLDQHHSSVEVPPRIHLDLYTEDQAAEVRRLVELGATQIHWDKQPADADYVILADPEGNRFCVVDAKT